MPTTNSKNLKTGRVCKMWYHNITKCDMLNGDGIRVVLWVSGCTMNCKNCQNPQTHDFTSGVPFDDDARQELFEALNKPYIQGITFSGGHPLEDENLNEVYKLIIDIKDKYPNKDIWLYTGYNFEDIINCPLRETNTILRKRIVEMCDIVIDGKYVDELRNITLKWRGSENQRIIDVKASLEQDKVVLWE